MTYLRAFFRGMAECRHEYGTYYPSRRLTRAYSQGRAFGRLARRRLT
jgi:hypothetical protein